jgi:hypothetical protein
MEKPEGVVLGVNSMDIVNFTKTKVNVFRNVSFKVVIILQVHVMKLEKLNQSLEIWEYYNI